MRSMMMTAALALMALTGSPVLAAEPAPAASTTADQQAITAVINGIADSLNVLDVPKFAGLHIDTPTILDEFAPFAWSGKDAVKAWLGDFGAWAKASDVAGTHVTFGAPGAMNLAGDRAYATVPSTITFTSKAGVATATLGQFAFLLVRQGSTWKIAGWAYTRTGTAK
ncbi:hypothetical protein [Novosphingobium sp.]|uniref:hypothetical protein n=1 Tax=Novosphingobium sp. TaxID=1874826 RepID=UPI00333F9788